MFAREGVMHEVYLGFPKPSDYSKTGSFASVTCLTKGRHCYSADMTREEFNLAEKVLRLELQGVDEAALDYFTAELPKLRKSIKAN